MRIILSIILTAALSFIAGLFLPWWSIAVVSFVIAFIIRQSLSLSFLSGFAAIFLLWGLLALWIDMKNDHLLSVKIARLLPLGGSSLALILVTGFVGGLVAGFAAFTAASVRARR